MIEGSIKKRDSLTNIAKLRFYPGYRNARFTIL